MNELRRKDRGIPFEQAKTILEMGGYGVLSTVNRNGKPYGVPLNYSMIDNSIYFHCAVEGQNIDNIIHNKFVSFCVVGKTELLPDQFRIKYQSVIVSGEAAEVFDDDKQAALEGFLKKYSSEFLEKGMKYIEGFKDKTRVFKITVNRITGKARTQ
jgi:uncharacterized protein